MSDGTGSGCGCAGRCTCEGSSGLWYRRGRTIVVLPPTTTVVSGLAFDSLAGRNVAAGALQRESAPRSSRQAIVDWIEGVAIDPRIVIDSRIDVGAQRAILRMVKTSPRLRADALGMLGSVKSGHLAGIFGDDLRRAAEAAARLGTVRWKLVPPGRDATVVAPPTSPPMIVFRESVRSVPTRLDPALRQAFKDVAPRLTQKAGGVLQVAFDPTNPVSGWFCVAICAACAAALLDGAPFDEIVPCELCLACSTEA